MLNKTHFDMAIHSKIGWLTQYYKTNLNLSTEQAYIYIRDSGIMDILRDKNSNLYLESVNLLVDAINIFYTSGRENMLDFLDKNIGA